MLRATQLRSSSKAKSIAFKHHFQFQPKIMGYEKPSNKLSLASPRFTPL
jgi:hypothetical protein